MPTEHYENFPEYSKKVTNNKENHCDRYNFPCTLDGTQ